MRGRQTPGAHFYSPSRRASNKVRRRRSRLAFEVLVLFSSVCAQNSTRQEKNEIRKLDKKPGKRRIYIARDSRDNCPRARTRSNKKNAEGEGTWGAHEEKMYKKGSRTKVSQRMFDIFIYGSRFADAKSLFSLSSSRIATRVSELIQEHIYSTAGTKNKVEGYSRGSTFEPLEPLPLFEHSTFWQSAPSHHKVAST